MVNAAVGKWAWSMLGIGDRVTRLRDITTSVRQPHGSDCGVEMV